MLKLHFKSCNFINKELMMPLIFVWKLFRDIMNKNINLIINYFKTMLFFELVNHQINFGNNKNQLIFGFHVNILF